QSSLPLRSLILLTAAWRWFLSRSQAATTWHSLMPRNASVLPGPCMPQPTTPSVTRSDGAVLPFAPSADDGMRLGAARAKPVAARKRRRLIPEVSSNFVISVMTPDPPMEFENKMHDSLLGAPGSAGGAPNAIRICWSSSRRDG